MTTNLQGAVTPEFSSYPLEDINELLDNLRSGTVLGRTVVVPKGV